MAAKVVCSLKLCVKQKYIKNLLVYFSVAKLTADSFFSLHVIADI